MEGKELAEILQNNIRMYATATKECLEYFVNKNILKESEIFPYSKQKAAKYLEIINEFLK